MINPIVIIITAALLISILVVSIINKPKKPIVTGVLILILTVYVASTFLLDNSLAVFGSENNINEFVKFIIMNDNPTYEDIESSFVTFKIFDISLIAMSFVSLFIEIMLILRKDSKR